jgi:thiol-disulfide isomerase/thioredoxin
MKKILIAGLLLVFALPGAFAQKTDKVVMDPLLHRDVLSGLCTRNGLEHGIFSHWFNEEYKGYHPDTTAIKAIAKKINKTSVTIVFGSWCGDSKMQVGRFYKILDKAGYKNPVKLIAVTRSLKADGQDISGLHIRRIPTFIVFYKGKEAGRIVESPRASLETDLASILQKVK